MINNFKIISIHFMTIKKYFGNDFMIVKYVFLIYELYNKFGLIKFPEAKIEKKTRNFQFCRLWNFCGNYFQFSYNFIIDIYDFITSLQIIWIYPPYVVFLLLLEQIIHCGALDSRACKIATTLNYVNLDYKVNTGVTPILIIK